MTVDLIAEVLAQHRTEVGSMRRLRGGIRTNGRQRLARPDGTDPAGFAVRVAAAYNEAVQATHRPAVVLAEEAGVPVTTVHRWIREARQRGALPLTRQGSVGGSHCWQCSCGTRSADPYAYPVAALAAAEAHLAEQIAEALQLGAPDVPGSEPVPVSDAPTQSVPAEGEVA